MAYSQDAARKVDLGQQAKADVRKILDAVKADKRTSLTAPEGKLVCDAYGIPVQGRCCEIGRRSRQDGGRHGLSRGDEDRIP
jgi:hypothetical protein